MLYIGLLCCSKDFSSNGFRRFLVWHLYNASLLTTVATLRFADLSVPATLRLLPLSFLLVGLVNLADSKEVFTLPSLALKLGLEIWSKCANLRFPTFFRQLSPFPPYVVIILWTTVAGTFTKFRRFVSGQVLVVCVVFYSCVNASIDVMLKKGESKRFQQAMPLKICTVLLSFLLKASFFMMIMHACIAYLFSC